MFKHSFKTNKTGNFKNNIESKEIYKELNFDLLLDFKGEITFSRNNDLLNLQLPENNNAIFLLTSKVRNPDLLIENIKIKEKINHLTIFASRINGCNNLDLCNDLITSRENKTEKRYRVHAKILIVNNFIILSSANLNNTNATIEQHLIINSECLSKQIKMELKQILKN